MKNVFANRQWVLLSVAVVIATMVLAPRLIAHALVIAQAPAKLCERLEQSCIRQEKDNTKSEHMLKKFGFGYTLQEPEVCELERGLCSVSAVSFCGNNVCDANEGSYGCDPYLGHNGENGCENYVYCPQDCDEPFQWDR